MRTKLWVRGSEILLPTRIIWGQGENEELPLSMKSILTPSEVLTQQGVVSLCQVLLSSWLHVHSLHVIGLKLATVGVFIYTTNWAKTPTHAILFCFTLLYFGSHLWIIYQHTIGPEGLYFQASHTITMQAH